MDDEKMPSLEDLRRGQSKKRFEPQIFQAQNEKQQAYIDKVNGKNQIPVTLKDEFQKQMEFLDKNKGQKHPVCEFSYDEAKLAFGKIYRNNLIANGKECIIDGNLKDIIPDLIKYLIYDKSSALDINKGLFIYGNMGCGKTYLLYCIKELYNAMKFHQFKIANAVTISNKLRYDNSYDAMQLYWDGRWAFDDLGSEGSVTIFGNVEDISKMLIYNWYENQHKKRIRLFATSNETPENLREKYNDERLNDRFKELFNFILLTGKSKR